jgi:DegV family protein with EDD domain
MNEYVIMADSASDLTMAQCEALSVARVDLTVTIGETAPRIERDVDVKEFYTALREKKTTRTAAMNLDDFMRAAEPILDGGKDILYLGFSSGLSSTYQVGRLAAEELSERYPDRKIYTVDSLCASLGGGLFVDLVAQKKAAGASLSEARDYAEALKMNICHEFTVDDLFFLKRGGRVSATTAIVGTALGIKPVMHVDNEGHLVNVMKVRGRRTAINTMADKLVETALDAKNGKIYISHGDCREDAEYLASVIAEKCGGQVEIITDVGAVIGAHSGPGTLALFFLGSER